MDTPSSIEFDSNPSIMLVPPRRGQRIKARILSHFYGGNDFQTVYSKNLDLYGILSGHTLNNHIGVWFGHDLNETMVQPNTVTDSP